MILSSPYDVIVISVRSEVGDQLLPPDQVFTDEDIIREINEAFFSRISNDWGKKYTVVNESLDPNILNDNITRTAIIIVASIRLLNIRKQIAIRQNIAISKGTTTISVDPLVKAFDAAIKVLENRYDELKLSGFSGIVYPGFSE